MAHRPSTMALSVVAFADVDEETHFHSHHEGQFFVIEHGVLGVDTGRGAWLMPPGRIGWLPPRWAHTGQSHGRLRGYAIYVAPEAGGCLPDGPTVFALSPFCASLVARLWEVVQGDGGDDARAWRLLGVLFDELAGAEREPLLIPMPQDPRLLRLARALIEEPSNGRGLDDWARDLGMSRRALTRRILFETGLTFGQWRTQVRMMSAVRMLSEGTSVTTIALSLGYDSVSAFIACFRRHFGTTPARYLPAGMTIPSGPLGISLSSFP